MLAGQNLNLLFWARRDGSIIYMARLLTEGQAASYAGERVRWYAQVAWDLAAASLVPMDLDGMRNKAYNNHRTRQS